MIALAEAQARLFALRGPVETEMVPLIHVAGRWAATDIPALRTQPAGDLSAMDGYAIHSADLPGPWQIIGESAAGHQFNATVARGEAVRIFTGAIVPDGADCILIQENAVCDGDVLSLSGETPNPGRHIRTAASDFAEGAVLISRGTRLTPACIGLAAMGGHAALPVRRKLRIALISTGDELRAPGIPCTADHIPSSNALMLSAMLAGMPVEIDDRGIVPDDVAALTAEFAACAGYDALVSIGGASVGDHDLVRPALQAAGASLDFWKIAMRPGKPVMAGIIGDAIVLGLPGNPVSAYVTALLLLKPLIAHLSGATDPLPPRIVMELGEPLPANGDRLDHLRGITREGCVFRSGANDSSMLMGLSQSNVLIIRDIDAPAGATGDLVSCLRLD